MEGVVGSNRHLHFLSFLYFQRFFAVKAATPGRHVARRDRPGPGTHASDRRERASTQQVACDDQPDAARCRRGACHDGTRAHGRIRMATAASLHALLTRSRTSRIRPVPSEEERPNRWDDPRLTQRSTHDDVRGHMESVQSSSGQC